jgi:glyoxylase-like metal-dependent hydrolase (beta-lactamase superfamily II)
MTNIKTIRLSMPYKLGSVNCYLIKNDINFMLIDTGSSNKRAQLEQELVNSGCETGNLKLIVITHGDFDHTGNAAYLRQKFSAQVAMHKDDSGMVERGDMFVNRNQPNRIIRKIIPVLSGFGVTERFTPDIFIEDGDDFLKHGFGAKVLSIPGHSRGSIGILIEGGDLFCGDLFENQKNPALNSIMDDIVAANASVEKLKSFKIKTVYPGHGESFSMDEFKKANR